MIIIKIFIIMIKIFYDVEYDIDGDDDDLPVLVNNVRLQDASFTAAENLL